MEENTNGYKTSTGTSITSTDDGLDDATPAATSASAEGRSNIIQSIQDSSVASSTLGSAEGGSTRPTAGGRTTGASDDHNGIPSRKDSVLPGLHAKGRDENLSGGYEHSHPGKGRGTNIFSNNYINYNKDYTKDGKKGGSMGGPPPLGIVADL